MPVTGVALQFARIADCLRLRAYNQHPGARLTTPAWWRHTPNALSTARLLATPVLLGAIVAGNRDVFKWLLLACLLSDILDGLIARVFNLRSELGARLDSTADILVFGIALAGLFRFESAALRAHWVPFAVVVGLYCAEAVFAILRYGRISSFHTVLVRIAAYLQGIFVMAWFLWGYQGWLMMTTVVLSSVAYVEELALVALLPKWTPDVRGLWWVVRGRRLAAQA